MRPTLHDAYINCRYRLNEVSARKNIVHSGRFLFHGPPNGFLDAQLTWQRREENAALHLEIEILKDIAVELLSVVLCIRSQGGITALNRYYDCKPVGRELWNNDLTPLHIRYHDGGRGWLIKNGTNFVAHKITPRQDNFLLELYLDAAGLHPQTNYEQGITRSSASPVIKAGRKYTIDITIIEKGDTAYPVLNRFPHGCHAAFLLTDHCDFDEAPNLHRFIYGNEGKGAWLGSGLKITKGVFTKRSPKAGFRAGTLEDESYLQLAEALYKGGNEIAPHAIQQSGKITVEQFREALGWLQQRFNCRSWIEHGNYLAYSYYMGGRDNEYKLVENLTARGYTSLWSYYDMPIDPFTTLNMLHNGRQGLAPGLYPALRKMAAGKAFQAFHLLRSYIARRHHGQRAVIYLLNLLSAGRSMAMSFVRRKKPAQAVAHFLQSLFTGGNKKEIGYRPYTAQEIRNFSPVLFPEDAAALAKYKPGQLFMFTTQEVVHTSDVYTSAALHRLAAERGIHIAHTYILNRLPYINGIFEKDGGLKKQWTDFVEALAAMVAEQRIWNPTLAGLTAHFSRLSGLDIQYRPGEIIIANPGSEAMSGLTFSIDAPEGVVVYWNGQQVASRYDHVRNSLFFWGDVPPRSTAMVTWQ